MQDFADSRIRMVDNQLRTNSVTNYRVLDAMTAVPREMFVDNAKRSIAYSDGDISLGETESGPRYLQKPVTFARMIQAAEIGIDDFVLVVGCNSGYALAVIALLASAVVGVEQDQDLATRASELMTELGVENADVVEGALNEGCASQGPFNVIVFDGSAEQVPEAILGQVRDGGRLIYVDGDSGSARAMLLTKSGDQIGKRTAFNTAAPRLPGFEIERGFVFEM